MAIKEGDFVKILTPTGKDFDDDRIGQVEDVDGSYILVKRNISGVVVELYPNELRLLEGEDHDMAYFQQNLWRGLRTPEENQAWLAEGYLREVDWEADQEENVTMSYDPLDEETTDFFFCKPKSNKLLDIINEVATKQSERQYNNVKKFLSKLVDKKKYDEAMKVVK